MAQKDVVQHFSSVSTQDCAPRESILQERMETPDILSRREA